MKIRKTIVNALIIQEMAIERAKILVFRAARENSDIIIEGIIFTKDESIIVIMSRNTIPYTCKISREMLEMEITDFKRIHI